MGCWIRGCEVSILAAEFDDAADGDPIRFASSNLSTATPGDIAFTSMHLHRHLQSRRYDSVPTR